MPPDISARSENEQILAVETGSLFDMSGVSCTWRPIRGSGALCPEASLHDGLKGDKGSQNDSESDQKDAGGSILALRGGCPGVGEEGRVDGGEKGH